jgi:peptide/nickel transport system substrate-binding protein
LAQKSKDTLLLGTQDPFATVDSYIQPAVEVVQFTQTIMSHMLVFDEVNGTFLPELAKSWSRPNPTTIDFDLRDDVVFHSGNKFTAEDVKYTIDYLLDPKVPLRFKGHYSWVKSAEVLGPYKVRITMQEPLAVDLFNFAYTFIFYDSAIHKALADKTDYGRVSPSGTGAYRALSVDANNGVLVERFEPALKTFPHLRAPIKRIRSIPVPDRQTQIAKLLTGEVNVITNITEDMAAELGKRKGIAVTPMPSKRLMYITLDAAGRSGNKIFTDVRVRQAFIKAIPRDQIAKNFVAGYDIAEIPKSICFAKNVGCDPSTEPFAYDPAGAKKLLAEAGYPNGVDIAFSVYEPFRHVGEAIIGELRKAGFRATLDSMTLGVYTARRAKGDLATLLAAFPTFTQPNVENMFDFFFDGERDYTKDPVILDIAKKGSLEPDVAKRTAIYREALDRINTQAYIYPMIEQPLVMAHTDDVRIAKSPLSVANVRVDDYMWK